ncbi:hypothetical protein K1719_034026 [Acacia pycnantha]|nr:hypothetical protein K1719_034026 [Acacia pycnantha]
MGTPVQSLESNDQQSSRVGSTVETSSTQQERKEGECSTGANSSGEIKINDSDVWRVVEKPRQRKKESNQRRAVDPSLVSGSRFRVLDVEEEREVSGIEGKQLVAVVASSEVTQVTKENVEESSKGVQRVEKRSRGLIQSKKEGAISVEKDFGQGSINGDAMGGLTKQGDETKCETLDRLRCVSKLGFDGLIWVPSVGRSGGLLAAWKSSLIEVEVLNLDRQLIHLRCRFPNDRWFCVTTVYAIPDRDHKQVLWNSLSNFASAMVYPWTVIGDFNDIACSEERTGGLGNSEYRFSLFSVPSP